jgi:MFS family permease
LSGLVINIGTVSSPVLTGYLFDTKGDYSIAFFILGIMALIGAVLCFSLPKKGMIGS